MPSIIIDIYSVIRTVYQYSSILFVLILSILLGERTSSNINISRKESSEFPLDTTIIDENTSWLVYRFKAYWSDDSLPDLAVDLLLAYAVVSPVLEKYYKDVQR